MNISYQVVQLLVEVVLHIGSLFGEVDHAQIVFVDEMALATILEAVSASFLV